MPARGSAHATGTWHDGRRWLHGATSSTCRPACRREAIVHASEVLAGGGELTAAETFPFALPVPLQAGPPLATDWGGLAWEVRAWADVAVKGDAEISRPLPLG